MKKLALILVLGLFAASCSSIDTIKKARGTGQTEAFEAGYDAVFDSALTAAAKWELKVVEENRDEGTIALSHGVTAESWGERIVVFITPLEGDVTEVEVISRPLIDPFIYPPDWEGRLLNDIGSALGAP